MLIILVSGKRLSGKNWFIENSIRILEQYSSEGKNCSSIEMNKTRNYSGYKCQYLSPSELLKHSFAKEYGLDVHRLIHDRMFKEQHRIQMTKYFEEKIENDGNYFDREIINFIRPNIDFLFMDIRLKRQIDFFEFNRNISRGVLKFRKEATLEERVNRGFRFNPLIDEEVYEIELDEYEEWDGIFQGNTRDELESFLQRFLVKPLCEPNPA